MRFDGMSQRRVGANAVVVATANAFPHQCTRVSELSKNALHCPFRDAHLLGNFAYSDVLVGGHSNQNKRVITEKRPSVAV